MTIRLALTLAGGASLGAYQGGVAYEFLWALSHRTAPKEPILIDVLTGSSAGALTAAVMARVLMVDRDSAMNLHRAWVAGISFEALMAGNPPRSLLSDKIVWDLARQVLGSRPQHINRHAAAPEKLLAALTLSNLNGVNYSLGYTNAPGKFDTTVFSDWIVFRLRPETQQEGGADVWPEIMRAAIASAAIPIAFPTVRLKRRLADYRGSEIYNEQNTREFSYVDGGLFNNEPVGLARDLVDELEESVPHVRDSHRIYVLVDPYVGETGVVREFHEDPLEPRMVLQRLVSMVIGESSKRDWIRAQRTNTRLRWQDAALEYLAEIIVRVSADERPQLVDRLESLVRDIATFKVAYSIGGGAPSHEAVQKHLDANLMRLGPLLERDGAAFTKLRNDAPQADLFLSLAYMLENVTGLRSKVPLDLYLIAPARGSLAGDFMGNLGGFFAQEWREHDWRKGRSDARDLLRQLREKHPSLDYEPDDPNAYIPARNLGHVDEKYIPAEAFDVMERRLKDSISTLIALGPTSFFKRVGVGWLSGFVAHRVVNHLRKHAQA